MVQFLNEEGKKARRWNLKVGFCMKGVFRSNFQGSQRWDSMSSANQSVASHLYKHMIHIRHSNELTNSIKKWKLLGWRIYCWYMVSYIHELYLTIIFYTNNLEPTRFYTNKSHVNQMAFISYQSNKTVLDSQLTPKEYALCLESYFHCRKAVQGKQYHIHDKTTRRFTIIRIA